MTSFVYFIRPVGLNGPVKIGVSRYPLRRVKELERLSPFLLEIITMVPGDKELEVNIHDCFLDTRDHGEWFRAEPRLLAAIAAIQLGVPVSVAIDLSDRRGDERAESYARRGASRRASNARRKAEQMQAAA